MVTGTVKNIAKFGAFVELYEGVEGLLHGSEISASGESWAWSARDHRGQKNNLVFLLQCLAFLCKKSRS